MVEGSKQKSFLPSLAVRMDFKFALLFLAIFAFILVQYSQIVFSQESIKTSVGNSYATIRKYPAVNLSGNRTHNDTNSGISFDYSPDWFETAPPQNCEDSVVNLVFLDNNTENNDLINPNIKIFLDGLPPNNITLANYRDSVQDFYKRGFSNFQLIDSSINSTFFPGRIAYKFTYSYRDTSTGMPLRGIEVGTIVNKTVLFVTYTAPAYSFKKYFGEFEHVVNSFQVTQAILNTSYNKLIDQSYVPNVSNNGNLQFIRYVSWPFAFKINYSQNWHPVEGAQDCAVMFIRPFDSRADDSSDVFCIRKGKIPFGVTINSSLSTEQLDSLYQSTIKTNQPFIKDTVLSEGMFTSAKGYKTYKFEILQNDTLQGDTFPHISQGMQYWIISDNDAYILEYVARQSTYQHNLPLAERMVNSFRILKDTYSEAANNQTIREMLVKDRQSMSFYIVRSSSMEPSLHVDDAVLASKSILFKNLNVKDIIVFIDSTNPLKTLISRIVDIQDDSDNGRVITTRMDSNPISIPGKDFVREENYLGKVVSIIKAPD
jgi:Signal peptidase, peptidase S26